MPIFGSLVWHDPREGIVAVLMTQQSSAPLMNDFGNAVMQSIIQSRPALKAGPLQPDRTTTGR